MSTEFIAVIGAIATVLAGFGGAALGACVAYKTGMKLVQETHKNAIAIMRRQEFNIAAAKLRAAFAPTLAMIYLARQHGDLDRPDVDTHIKAALLAHGAAIEMFRPFVSAGNSTEYQKAWEDYRKAVAMDQYALAAEAKIKDIQSTELLEQKIHNILQLAKCK